MSESWHPRKTEKDVAVARAGVAKYDRGWKYGAGVHEHDHSEPDKGGEVLKPEQLFHSDTSRPTWSKEDKTVSLFEFTETLSVSGSTIRVFQIPFNVRHAITVDVPDGDYSGEDWLFPAYRSQRMRRDILNESNKVTIQGNQTTPANCKVNSITCASSDDLFLRLRGFQIEGDNPFDDEDMGVAAYNATILCADIVINGSTNGFLAWGPRSCILVNGVDIGAGGSIAGDGLKVKQRGTIEEQGGVADVVTGRARDQAYAGNGTIMVDWANDSLTGKEQLIGEFWRGGGGGLFLYDASSGRQIVPGEGLLNHYLYEDWQDDDFGQQRHEMRIGEYWDGTKYPRYARFLPQWQNNTGTDPISYDRAGVVTLPSNQGSRLGIETFTDFDTGTWDVSYRAESAPTSGQLDIILLYVDDNNQIRVSVIDGGTLELQKVDAGTVTTLISGTWPDDTAQNSVKVTRDSAGNWELFSNGTSQGTATDTFLPSGNDRRVAFSNGLDVNVSIISIILD